MPMRIGIREETRRNCRFFHVSFLYINLQNYYELNFSLMHDHKFDLNAINEMIPWERDIYVILLKKWLEEEKKRIEEHNSKMKSRRR